MPRIKLLLAMVTGFTLGVALCAAWFLARQPPVPASLPVVAPITLNGDDSPTRAESLAIPWKSREVKLKSEPTGGKEESESAVNSIRILKRMFAHRDHDARTRALRMSSWLGLDSHQAATLEAVLLEKGADGILEIPEDIEPWVKANLRPEQAEAYTRYQISTRKDEAEASALKEVHEMAQAIELSEDQRDALFQKKFEFTGIP